jgi:hypothetical protein
MLIGGSKYGVGDGARAMGRWWLPLVAAVLLFGVSACASGTVASNPPPTRSGTAGMTSPPGGPPMPSDPLPSRAVAIGLTDNGKTVTLQTGQRLHVVLAANWTPPQARSSGDSVTASLQPLRTDAAEGFPSGEAGAAMFTAVRTGTAVITARTDFGCLHTTPRCLPPQQSFTVTVRVLPPSGTGAGPLPKPPHP